MMLRGRGGGPGLPRSNSAGHLACPLYDYDYAVATIATAPGPPCGPGAVPPGRARLARSGRTNTSATDRDAYCGPGRCLPPRSPGGDGAGGILIGHVAFYAARRACTVCLAPGGARKLQAGPL